MALNKQKGQTTDLLISSNSSQVIMRSNILSNRMARDVFAICREKKSCIITTAFTERRNVPTTQEAFGSGRRMLFAFHKVCVYSQVTPVKKVEGVPEFSKMQKKITMRRVDFFLFKGTGRKGRGVKSTLHKTHVSRAFRFGYPL